jgi:lysozyme
MKISRLGIDLITRWEGCKLDAYKDGGGVWTIGYGHTSMAGAPEVKKGLKITLQDAKDIFVRDIVRYEAAVSKALTRTPTQAQFDAMVSLCYNIGPGAFAGSTLVRKFNAGDVAGAHKAFGSWIKDNGKVVKGLQNRRADEQNHFGLNVPTMGAQPLPKSPVPTMPPITETPSSANPEPSVGLLKAFLSFLAFLFMPKKG